MTQDFDGMATLAKPSPEVYGAECVAVGSAFGSELAAAALARVPLEAWSLPWSRATAQWICQEIAAGRDLSGTIAGVSLAEHWPIVREAIADHAGSGHDGVRACQFLQTKYAARVLARQLLEAGRQALHAGTPSELTRVHDSVVQAAPLVSDGRQKWHSAEDLALREYAALDRAKEEYAAYVPTGLSALDRVLVGYAPGTVTLLGARPGQGKTSYAMQLCALTAKQGAVAVFGLEMTPERLQRKWVCAAAGVSLRQRITGDMTAMQIQRYTAALSQLSKLPVYFWGLNALTPHQLVAEVRELKRRHPLRLVVIDYIQLMAADDSHSEGRFLELSQISTAVTLAAKEAHIPILALAQLNRKTAERKDPTPIMSDLRGSGQLEQDADNIIFLHRPETYDPADKPGVAQFIVAKGRDFGPGRVAVGFDAQTTTFTEGGYYGDTEDTD